MVNNIVNGEECIHKSLLCEKYEVTSKKLVGKLNKVNIFPVDKVWYPVKFEKNIEGVFNGESEGIVQVNGEDCVTKEFLCEKYKATIVGLPRELRNRGIFPINGRFYPTRFESQIDEFYKEKLNKEAQKESKLKGMLSPQGLGKNTLKNLEERIAFIEKYISRLDEQVDLMRFLKLMPTQETLDI